MARRSSTEREPQEPDSAPTATSTSTPLLTTSMDRRLLEPGEAELLWLVLQELLEPSVLKVRRAHRETLVLLARPEPLEPLALMDSVSLMDQECPPEDWE